MPQRFSRTDSPQGREKKLNDLIEKIFGSGFFRYPVGSVYLTTTTQNPRATLGYGTWQLIGSGNLFN